MGPGLLESTDETCLAYELRQLGFKVEQQLPLRVVYKDVKLDCGYRLDLVVEDSVILEIKAVQELAPIHDAQMLSYYGSRVKEWAGSSIFMCASLKTVLSEW